MRVDASGRPAPVVRPAPLPRINPAAAVRGNALYVLGGVLEVGDREVTLDDCWSYDLTGRSGWTCLWPGTMHRQVWRGIDSDVDGDSYVSSDQGGDVDGEDEDGSDGGSAGGFETIEEDGEAGGTTEEERKRARKAAKKEKVSFKERHFLVAADVSDPFGNDRLSVSPAPLKKTHHLLLQEKEKRRGVRHEISALKERLGVDDGSRTPRTGESMSDFYARTTDTWNADAEKSAETRDASGRGERMSAKEVKRAGFDLARARYDELRPVLERLAELEGEERDGEERRAARKERKSKKKKDRGR